MRIDVCMLGMVCIMAPGSTTTEQGQEVDINSDDYFNLYLCAAWLATIYKYC